jgi:glutamine cyclotransferase
MAVNNNTELEPLVLGDVDGNFSLGFETADLTYLSGIIWAASYTEAKIYRISPVTGAELSSIDVDFPVSGLTTDGTYLFASLYDVATGNGTIAKYQTDGTFVSKLYFPLNSYCFQGLAWDGSHLWASQILPHRILRINPTTGEIVTNVSCGMPFVGLVWRDNLLWGADNNDDIIRAVYPATGRTCEVFDAPHTVGEYGMAYNGTHFFFSEWHTDNIYVLPIPTTVGEVWNQYPAPSTWPGDLAWNGTHYFVGDSVAQKIYILHDGTFEEVDDFDVAFEIYGVTIVGDYLYIGQYASPYTIHKFALDGTYISNFSTSHRYFGLEYDGARLWATDHLNAYIYELDPTDCSVIATHSTQVKYAGLTYDAENDVFWAVDLNNDIVFQLNPSSFQKTGVQIDSPPGTGYLGIEFNGEHLILTEFSADIIYKLIIDLPSGGGGGGIPGFANYLFLLSVFSLIAMVILLRQGKHHTPRI